MFFDCKNEAVRYIGRWGEWEDAMAATAAGSKFQVAFKGKRLVLKFKITEMNVIPHVWMSLDEENWFDAKLDNYLSLNLKDDTQHTLSVVFKGGKECDNRWNTPLTGVVFQGFEAEAVATLPPFTKKTIELIGDSITEGVVVDGYLSVKSDSQDGEYSKPIQDDFFGTYGCVAANILGLEPLAGGYGALGVTHGGCGGVVKASQMYNFAFNNAPITYASPDYILINLGTNDRRNVDTFEENYIELLDVITAKNPHSKIACMVPFIGCFKEEIPKIVEEYNKKNGTKIGVVKNSGDWLDHEIVHPNREGHRIAGEKLAAELKVIYGL